MSQQKKLEIKDRVRDFRVRAKLSQEQLGELLGVSGNYIHLIEKGAKQPGDSLLKLFDTLDDSPLYQSENSRPSGVQEVAPPYRTAEVYSHLGLETLFKTITDLSRRLIEVEAADRGYLLRNIRSILDEIQRREAARPVSSKPLTEAQRIAKRASESAESDPSS